MSIPENRVSAPCSFLFRLSVSDNFHYLYKYGRYQGEPYDLTECRHSQIGYAEYTVQSRGRLLWPKSENEAKPYLILTGTGVAKEYLDYLDRQNISWIACGEGHVDLVRASEILAEKFGVTRMGIVGGPKINTAFLEAGLLDEISLLIGSGIDGRGGMPAVFDGLDQDHDVTGLKLMDVQKFDSDAVWLRYRV